MSNPYEENSDPARVTLENRGGRQADDPVRGGHDGYPESVSLAELGLTEDVGRDWHPTKPEAWDGDVLRDLDDDEVAEHQAKPEADHAEELLAAEDSAESPEGVI